ncbi:MAG: sigma-70 family RNA polymerase sigma factor [Pirellulaceae bacterium]|jgi:RNA polymerase primary sigma factor/RNA polymerase sigma factor|nr:sigma-70 family RNA polymerase sigma factor [Pirellulaceae bacterium]
MHSDYNIPAIRELRDQLVRFAPRERKLEQLDRAERLIAEIDAERRYTYEYLCFRVTGYRPHAGVDVAMTGAETLQDLLLLVEDLSDSADVPVEESPEPVYTVEQLSKNLNVSTKTISRWRRQGLVSRRFVFDGRKRVGFLNSSVQRFVSTHADRVERGGRFSQLTDAERSTIIDRARRLAHAGGGPAEVTRRIAKHMNRSVETIRYTLKQFDQKHPHLAIFPDHSGPLTKETKKKIYQQFRRGTSVDALANRYGRTKTSIYRVVNEMRARAILELPLDYMFNREFDAPNAEKTILAPLPDSNEPRKKTRVPAGLPRYLASLYEVPLLTREQEQHLFRRFNYLKHRVARLREQLDPARAKSSLMDRIETLYDEAVLTKNQIVQANLRLVVSIAKRHVTSSEDFFGLVSDGNMSLIRAVEKFDYSRGNKFSTYASWAIMKNFARTIPDEFKHRDRFRTSHDETFTSREDERSDRYEQESAQVQRQRQIGRILSRLDEREQKIIISRFGLDHRQEPLTLKEVGHEMGVTKERVRQIEARALNKLRLAAQEEQIELPD